MLKGFVILRAGADGAVFLQTATCTAWIVGIVVSITESSTEPPDNRVSDAFGQRRPVGRYGGGSVESTPVNCKDSVTAGCTWVGTTPPVRCRLHLTFEIRPMRMQIVVFIL